MMKTLCCTMMPPPKSSLREALRETTLSKARKSAIRAHKIKRPSTIDADTVKLLIPAVSGLHWRNSLEIHELLKENKDFCIYYKNGEKINVETLAGALPLHLLTVIKAPDKFGYLLSGIRLLHTLCELTSRHSILDKVLLGDCVLSAKMVDLVINMMVALGGNRKESWQSDKESLIEATMVASTLHLLHGFISPEFQDIVQILLAHSKVDLFIETAFGAVHNVVRSLEAKLLYRPSDQTRNLDVSTHLGAANFHCQQAEAALQFLHSLYQHKLFSDRVARNKEVCGKGGVLMLAESILSLGVSTEFVGEAKTIASMYRMKAKVLSLLYHLFEEDENVCFLDKVERSGNLHLAQPIASEVLKLLKYGLPESPIGRSPPEYPMGLLLLNAMRLADVFSDDTNFRRFFTDHFSMILSAVFRLSNEEFVSMFCSSNLSSKEDDATVEYDLFKSAGWVLSIFTCLSPPQFKLNFQNNLTMSSYAHQRTSLLIKIIANLHCFSPGICTEDDRKRFIDNFVSGLRKDPLSMMSQLPNSSYAPVAQIATSVPKNLCSLWHHANFLIASDLDVKDVMMFRVFCMHLQPLICSEFERSQAAVKQRKEPQNIERASGAGREYEVNENMHTRSRRRKSLVEAGESSQAFTKVFKGSGSGEVKEDEKHGKKRKRSRMSDDQMEMIERAIADEPDMRRSSDWMRTWAEKLNQNGPRVTAMQLRNWVNNRKAKLAREMSEKTSKRKK